MQSSQKPVVSAVTPGQLNGLENIFWQLDQWTDKIIERTDELLHSDRFIDSSHPEAVEPKAA
jgi:hypothetical protein